MTTDLSIVKKEIAALINREKNNQKEFSEFKEALDEKQQRVSNDSISTIEQTTLQKSIDTDVALLAVIEKAYKEKVITHDEAQPIKQQLKELATSEVYPDKQKSLKALSDFVVAMQEYQSKVAVKNREFSELYRGMKDYQINSNDRSALITDWHANVVEIDIQLTSLLSREEELMNG